MRSRMASPPTHERRAGARYSVHPVWNDDPDYETVVRDTLDLLLLLESEEKLDSLLDESANTGASVSIYDDDPPEAA